MRFHFGTLASPIGLLQLVWDEDARLRLLYFDADEQRIRQLIRRSYGQCELDPAPLPAWLSDPLAQYFGGDIAAIASMQVAAAGTEFQREVWAALRTIPGGRTTSYGALAMKLHRPGASRAVGLANGSNPIGLVVPCHRVIGADGTLTGYGGGLPRKQWLLEHERRHAGIEPQLELFVAPEPALDPAV
jgi:methylated-DNA-[protein]-cysteine S-methyltransferase